jgi:hypothetical protein
VFIKRIVVDKATSDVVEMRAITFCNDKIIALILSGINNIKCVYSFVQLLWLLGLYWLPKLSIKFWMTK